jgi:hypothetical protein
MAPGPRLFWLAGVPLAWAILLVFHPTGGDSPYDMIAGATDRFLIVHVGSVVFIPLMAVAVVVLLHDVPGRAARIGRWAMAPFAVFYLAYETFTGVGSGVLVNEGAGKELVNDFFQNPLAGEPSVFNSIGSAAWVIGLIAAGVAVRKAGAPMAVAILVALGAVASAHPFPTGPAALLCFAVGAVLFERSPAHRAVAPPPRVAHG